MDDIEVSSQPTVYAFLRTILDDWSTKMSGPATVPLAIAALFVKIQTLRILFAILAVLCGGFSAYWIWRKERLSRIAAERAFSRAQAIAQNEQNVLLRDIVAELEDNLKIALSPQTRNPFGSGAYFRPSDSAWKQCRSKVQLPDPLRRQIQDIYDLIGRWASIVDTRVKPALGSAELHAIAQRVGALLPQIIAELKNP